jgi:hypothetical protein
MGEIGGETEMRAGIEKRHRRRRAEERPAAMGLMINGQAVFCGEGARVIEELQVFLEGEVIAAGVRVEIERF